MEPINVILMKTKLHLRHLNSLKCFVYVLIDKSKTVLEAILAHSYGCEVEECVVDCYSHIL